MSLLSLQRCLCHPRVSQVGITSFGIIESQNGLGWKEPLKVI